MRMKTIENDIKLKRLRELLVEFSNKAKIWGYQQDSGVESEVGVVEHEYKKAQDKLVTYLNRVLKDKERKSLNSQDFSGLGGGLL